MRQKYTLSTLLALLAIASLANTINASSANIQVRQQIKADSRQEVRTKLETIKVEKLDGRLTYHTNNLQARFTYHYDRLNAILGKIEAIIDKKVTEGINMDAAKVKLDEARVKLEQAKTIGSQAIAAFKALNPDKLNEQKTEIKAARDLAVKARQTFIDALQLMQQTVKLIRIASK